MRAKPCSSSPLEALYRRVLAPIATPGTPGAWYRGWRVMSLDGTTLDVADTTENARAFGRPASTRGANTTGAFPQLRLVGLLENGTHVISAAALGPYGAHERALATDVLPSLTGDMLVLADRGFLSFDLWRPAAATGAALVWRVSAHLGLCPCWSAMPMAHIAVSCAGISAVRVPIGRRSPCVSSTTRSPVRRRARRRIAS